MAEASSTKALVFISYSRRDEEFAATLSEAFQRAGREAWRDKDDIRPVAKWAKEISTGIDSSDVIVFLLSPDFVASAECVKEIKHAAGRQGIPGQLVRIEHQLAGIDLSQRPEVDLLHGGRESANAGLVRLGGRSTRALWFSATSRDRCDAALRCTCAACRRDRRCRRRSRVR